MIKKTLKSIVIMMIATMSLCAMKVEGRKITANPVNTVPVATVAPIEPVTSALLVPGEQISEEEEGMYEELAIDTATEMLADTIERPAIPTPTEDELHINEQLVNRELMYGQNIVAHRRARQLILSNMGEEERNNELLKVSTVINMVQNDLQVRSISENMYLLLNKHLIRSIAIFMRMLYQSLQAGVIVTPDNISITIFRRIYSEILVAIDAEKYRLSNATTANIPQELIDTISEVYLDELVNKSCQQMRQFLQHMLTEYPRQQQNIG